MGRHASTDVAVLGTDWPVSREPGARPPVHSGPDDGDTYAGLSWWWMLVPGGLGVAVAAVVFLDALVAVAVVAGVVVLGGLALFGDEWLRDEWS
jgi:hypothetical protein